MLIADDNGHIGYGTVGFDGYIVIIVSYYRNLMTRSVGIMYCTPLNNQRFTISLLSIYSIRECQYTT